MRCLIMLNIMYMSFCLWLAVSSFIWSETIYILMLPGKIWNFFNKLRNHQVSKDFSAKRLWVYHFEVWNLQVYKIRSSSVERFNFCSRNCYFIQARPKDGNPAQNSSKWKSCMKSSYSRFLLYLWYGYFSTLIISILLWNPCWILLATAYFFCCF